MGYRAMAALGVAALMLAGAPMYTRAESTSETPSATEKTEQKAEQLGGKATRTAKEAVCDPLRNNAVTPGKAEGEVVKVDTAGGKVTIREPDGKSHEYLASQKTLREFKEGDRVQVTFTQARSC